MVISLSDKVVIELTDLWKEKVNRRNNSEIVKSKERNDINFYIFTDVN